jgi:DNA-binding MarR family transcriptional regulator
MRPDDPSPVPEAMSDRLGYLLGRAHLAHRQVAESRLATFGVRAKEYGALSILESEGPLSQQRLGQLMGVDRTTMVAVANALEGRGLVERERDPTDRRAYALHVTKAGRRLLSRATKAVSLAEDEFLADLSVGERRQLKTLLRRLVAR